MDREVSEREDAYYDEAVGMVVTRSGKARWRKRLTEARERIDPAAREALKQRLGLS
jgi:hypothetical protein